MVFAYAAALATWLAGVVCLVAGGGLYEEGKKPGFAVGIVLGLVLHVASYALFGFAVTQ